MTSSYEVRKDHSAVEWKAARWREWAREDRHTRVTTSLENHGQHTAPAGVSFRVPCPPLPGDTILASIFLTIFPLCHFSCLSQEPQESLPTGPQTGPRACFLPGPRQDLVHFAVFVLLTAQDGVFVHQAAVAWPPVLSASVD